MTMSCRSQQRPPERLRFGRRGEAGGALMLGLGADGVQPGEEVGDPRIDVPDVRPHAAAMMLQQSGPGICDQVQSVGGGFDGERVCPGWKHQE
jgi:hypothetical protein